MKSACILLWWQWCNRSQHWYEHSGICLQMCWCISPSLTPDLMWSSSSSQLRRNGVSRVRLRVTLLTKSSRETDLISTSGLHPANVACQSTLPQFLVPPSEEYILMDQSLKSAQARPIISYWMKTPLRPTVIQTNVQGGNQKHLNPVIYYL